MGTPASRVAALEEGNAVTFDAVYEAEFDFVYRIVSRLAKSQDIDDLVQEVFLVVHRRLAEFRGDARLSTWLFRIAYRVVGAHIRRERIRRRARQFLGFERSHPAPEPTDEQARVRAALDAISYERRSVLVLFEVEGWTAKELASFLGIPEGTVYRRLHEARAAFRRAYPMRGGEP